jgi:beta-glucosidase
MKNNATRIMTRVVPWTALFIGLIAQSAIAQDTANLPYMNPQRSPEQRATDLVRRMNLAEKALEMQNNSAAVPRLSIPAYQWWSEALHGVINDGVTEYPEPIGLAATFDARESTPWRGGLESRDESSSCRMYARDTPASWEAWISGPRT